MQIAIVAVGKVKQAGLRIEIDDYLTRIRRYSRCQEIEIRDGPEKQLIAQFRKVISHRTTVVALEVDGVAYSSRRFAQFLSECELKSKGMITILIGGSDGLPKQISDIADLKMSLSPMTFPHRLARLVLVEQIYRGFTILKNEPYSQH